MAQTKPAPNIRFAPVGATWASLMADLKKVGISQSSICEATGAKPSTVSALTRRADGEPGYNLGSYVIELHGKMREAGLIPK